MIKAVWFDMDGTIADLYGQDNWLEHLMAGHNKPYREAAPMVDMRQLGREIKRLQSAGVKVGVISWLSKTATKEYQEHVTKAKLAWLKRHLGSVTFDEINIVPYGTPKHEVGEGVLFDDELPNRNKWNSASKTNVAMDVHNIIDILKAIAVVA